MNIPEKLAELRKIQRWGRLRVAGVTGLSHQTVKNVESGNVDPRLGSVEAIADALGYRLELVPKNDRARRAETHMLLEQALLYLMRPRDEQ